MKLSVTNEALTKAYDEVVSIAEQLSQLHPSKTLELQELTEGVYLGVEAILDEGFNVTQGDIEAITAGVIDKMYALAAQERLYRLLSN